MVDFKQAQYVFGFLLLISTAASLASFWAMGFFSGGVSPKICRGAYLYDFDDSGVQDYELYNEWSLEPIRYADTG